MSRSCYILAGTLGFFAVVSFALALAPSSAQPGLPANASIWRTVGLFVLLGALACALIGVLSHLFEQVDRRSQQARQAARLKRRSSAPYSFIVSHSDISEFSDISDLTDTSDLSHPARYDR